MRQDERIPFHEGTDDARRAAHPQGEYVGQESFLTAGEIRRIGTRARIGPDVEVLDLCCGTAGPGRYLVAETGCGYLGVDSSASALGIARQLAGDLPCRFSEAQVPPLPPGRFDVVLLLETMLAFPDKRALLAAVAGALAPGGRFALTLEEGPPLTAAERVAMPDADTVWLVELAEFTGLLAEAGFSVTWREEWSAAHRRTAAALLAAYRAHADDIAAQVGARALGELVTAHELWCAWLGSGRVRKFALVAEKR